jgi:hypothetical protein
MPQPEDSSYKFPYQDLLFRYRIDPVEEGMSSMIFNFNSISDKMSDLLGKPEIKSDRAFSLKALTSALLHPELSNRFTEKEIDSMNLMLAQARRLVDVDRSTKPSLGGLGTTINPDKTFISREFLLKLGAAMGIIRDA